MGASASTALPIMAGIAAGVVTANPAVGMAVMGAAGALASGVEAKRAASRQAARLEQQQSYERRNAAEQALAIQDERRRASGAMAAKFAGRGISGSLTASTFEREIIDQADRRIRANDLNLGNAISDLDMRANAVEDAGRAELIKGIGSAAMTAYGAYGDYQALQGPTVGQPTQLVPQAKPTGQKVFKLLSQPRQPQLAGIY